jgi:hypothetical protein
MIFQFKIKKHNGSDDKIGWEAIEVDHEACFADVEKAGRYALAAILGNDEKREIQEIRFNAKGSFQGHYIAGFSKLTWSYQQSGKLRGRPANDNNDNDYLAAIYSSQY